MTTTTGRRIMEDLVASAVGHVDGLTPHKLRHFFITAVYNSSNDLHETMVLARHKNIGITVRYTHRKNAKIKNTYAKAMKDK